MKKLLAIGEALIDFIPAQRDCLLKEVEQFTRVCGGAPANVAAAAAKLGGDSSLISQLGRDAFGDYIVDTLADAGVDTSKICRTDRANTALAFVSLKADGNRDFSFYRKPSADMLLEPEQLEEAWFANTGVLHFGRYLSLMRPFRRRTAVPFLLPKSTAQSSASIPTSACPCGTVRKRVRHGCGSSCPLRTS